jgi:uncharacterized protein
MQCPIDNETLVMADRSGVEIDYCPKCRGVWLDRGELDKIIARAAGGASEAAPSARAPAQGVAPVYQPEPQRTAPREEPRRRDDDYDDDDRYYGKKKRRESFLGELFDF